MLLLKSRTTSTLWNVSGWAANQRKDKDKGSGSELTPRENISVSISIVNFSETKYIVFQMLLALKQSESKTQCSDDL